MLPRFLALAAVFLSLASRLGADTIDYASLPHGQAVYLYPSADFRAQHGLPAIIQFDDVSESYAELGRYYWQSYFYLNDGTLVSSGIDLYDFPDFKGSFFHFQVYREPVFDGDGQMLSEGVEEFYEAAGFGYSVAAGFLLPYGPGFPLVAPPVAVPEPLSLGVLFPLATCFLLRRPRREASSCPVPPLSSPWPCSVPSCSSFARVWPGRSLSAAAGISAICLALCGWTYAMPAYLPADVTTPDHRGTVTMRWDPARSAYAAAWLGGELVVGLDADRTASLSLWSPSGNVALSGPSWAAGPVPIADLVAGIVVSPLPEIRPLADSASVQRLGVGFVLAMSVHVLAATLAPLRDVASSLRAVVR